MTKRRRRRPAMPLPLMLLELNRASWDVIARRSLMMARGTCSAAEYARMVQEKTTALRQSATNWRARAGRRRRPICSPPGTRRRPPTPNGCAGNKRRRPGRTDHTPTVPSKPTVARKRRKAGVTQAWGQPGRPATGKDGERMARSRRVERPTVEIRRSADATGQMTCRIRAYCLSTEITFTRRLLDVAAMRPDRDGDQNRPPREGRSVIPANAAGLQRRETACPDSQSRTPRGNASR